MDRVRSGARGWHDRHPGRPASAGGSRLEGVAPRSWADLARDAGASALPLIGEADVSQLAAIDAVSRGVHLLAVESPPGTGKARTIANLLARAAAAGQRALFVAAVPASLDRVRRELSAASSAPPLAEAELAALERARAALDGEARALHEVHWPLDRSLADVLGELSTLHAIPTLAWRPDDPEILTGDRLAEIEDLARRLDAVPPGVQDPDFPWRRLLDGTSAGDSRSEWVDLLSRARSATEDLRRATGELARRQGRSPAETPADVFRQLDLAELAGTIRSIPAHWLTELDLVAAREEAAEWASESAHHHAALEALQKRFQRGLFELADEDLQDLERAGAEVQGLLGRRPGEVLEDRVALFGFLEATRRALAACGPTAERVAEAVGWKAFVPTLDATLRLARIAALLHGPDRPRAEWLDRNACVRAEVAMREQEAFYAKYRTARRAVLVDYRESVAELDAEAMLERFRKRWRGPLRVFRPGYRRDLAQLRAHRTDHRTPAEPEQDLALIKAFRQQAALLAPQQRKFQSLLGPQDPGPEGSFAAARRALAAARQVLDLLTDPATLEGLAERLRDGAASSDIVTSAASLQNYVETVTALQDRAQGLLPSGRVSGEETDVAHLPFPRLLAWLDRARAAVERVAARHWMIAGLQESVGDRPFSYDDALDIVLQLTAARRFERRLAAASGHLRSVYGRLFNGRGTDWPAVVAALERAESLRERMGDGQAVGSLETAHDDRALSVDYSTLRARLAELEDLYRRIQERFDQAHTRRRHPIDPHQPWASIESSLETLEKRVDERQAWIEYSRLRADFEEAGLWPLLEELEPPQVPPLDRAAAARKAALLAWCAHHLAASPSLAATERQHEELVAGFRALDRRHREAGAATLAPASSPAVMVLADAVPPPDGPAFDLVVADEAVALPLDPIHAVSAQAASVVVFGDSRRLPPASERPTVLADLLAAGAPVVRLAFPHGRRPEPVITFANAVLYGGALVVTPSPDPAADRAALKVETVRGVELAERVRALLAERDASDASRVVVAAATSRLRAALDPAIAGHPRARLTDVSGAQGEPASTLILCLDGEDSGGGLADWELNAALALCAGELVLVRVGDPPAASEASLLGRFLAHLASGHPSTDPPSLSFLRREVAAAVRALGYEVEHEPGGGPEPLALAVRDPRRPGARLLGIDCDDRPGRAAWPARDRHRLRPESFESRGWRIHHVRSVDWAMDREGALARLTEAIRAAPATVMPATAAPKAPSPPPPRPTPPPEPPHAPEPHVASYVVARLPRVALPGSLSAEANQAALVDLVRAVVHAEGPVHRDLAVTRILDGCGIARRGRSVMDAMAEAVKRAGEEGLVMMRGAFLYAPASPEPARLRVPDPADPGTRRAAHYIPPEEIRLAAGLVAGRQPGLAGAALFREVGRLLGHSRLDKKGRAHVVEALRPSGR